MNASFLGGVFGSPNRISTLKHDDEYVIFSEDWEDIGLELTHTVKAPNNCAVINASINCYWYTNDASILFTGFMALRVLRDGVPIYKLAAELGRPLEYGVFVDAGSNNYGETNFRVPIVVYDECGPGSFVYKIEATMTNIDSPADSLMFVNYNNADSMLFIWDGQK